MGEWDIPAPSDCTTSTGRGQSGAPYDPSLAPPPDVASASSNPAKGLPAFLTLPLDFEARILSGESKTHTLRNIVVRQQLARLAMKGINAKLASGFVGVCAATAQAIYRDPKFKAEVYGKVDGAFTDVDKAFKESKQSVHERIAARADVILDQLFEMMDDTTQLPTLRAKIMMDVLDRNPETQPGHTVTRLGGAMTPEQLAQAAQIAREMDRKIESPNILPMKRRA